MDGSSTRPAPAWTIGIMALAAIAVHLVVNAAGGYGYFRDELYYIACSKRLAAGYVDQPPLSIFVLAGLRPLVGDSLFALRAFPAFLAGVSVALLGILAWRLGGGRRAIVLGALAFLAAPYLMAFHTFFSMNSLDIMFWLLAVLALVRVLEAGDRRSWLLLGLALGLGLLNKTSVLWLGAGMSLAVVAVPRLRRQLRGAGPFAAAALALGTFSPFLLWNAVHGWPHVEFVRNALFLKYASLTPGRFLSDQFLAMNPITFAISIPGLVWCFTRHGGDRGRALGVTFSTVFVILLFGRHTKAEYVAAAYPMLFASGGVALERLRRPWGTAAAWGLGGLLVITGAVLAPMAMPVLPVPTYVRYARALGVAPGNSEGKELAELPQFFADMHGWEELARNVSRAYLTLPEAERERTVAFVTNYGDAGALEFFAGRYALPRVICNHNAYWFWGVGQTPIETFIRLGGEPADYRETYGDVRLVGKHTCTYCMPYENNLNILVVRDRHVPIERDWAQYKHFE